MNLFLVAISVMALFVMSIVASSKNSFSSTLKKYDWVLWALFTLLVLIRDRGWDYELYREIYYSIRIDNLYAQWTEPGYLLLMLFGRSLYLSFDVFSFLIAAANMYFIKKVAEYFDVNPTIALFFFVLFYYFRFPYGQVRQSLSISLFLYSITKIRSETGKYILLNAFASTIHVSALVAVPYFFVQKILNERRYFYAVIPAIVVLSYLLVEIPVHDFLERAGIAAKYNYYVSLEDQSASIIHSTQLPLIVVSIMAILIILQHKNFTDRDIDLFSAFLFGVLIFLVFSFNLRLADRIAAYFLIMSFIILAALHKKLDKYLKIVFLMLVSLLGVVYLSKEFLMMQNQVLEYKW